MAPPILPGDGLHRTPLFNCCCSPPNILNSHADFAIWDDGFKVTGPVEIAYLVNGRPLDTGPYTTPGVKHFEKPVPADWLSADAETTLAMAVTSSTSRLTMARNSA